MSVEPFNRLVKLAARAFYDDITTKADNQPKTGRSDNRGIAVVVLDALTRRQWVREEDLAKDLKLHSKQLRRTLRFFEEEKLVTRDHRKETAKGAKMYSAAIAATADGQQVVKEGDEKVKLHTHSYCCLDYAQIYDVVRYRLHRMRKKLKDELENKNTVQEYICPNCERRYFINIFFFPFLLLFVGEPWCQTKFTPLRLCGHKFELQKQPLYRKQR
uniref:HTH TFE/IIEalpha-type domain-containing protein n=1 Tax=Rhizophora mucronata TaxID=61149 RepID=A0A2P2M1F5_RHIMU